MRQQLVRSIALLVCCGAAACGIKVTAANSGALRPSPFDGEWVGAWQAGPGAVDVGGPLTVRMQQFQGQPVVAVDIDNPCITSREYELQLSQTTIELRADGEVVFGGVLGEGPTLLGTYRCAAATGAWTATWRRALPTIVDLSGTWRGRLLVPGGETFDVEFALEQVVRSGALVLEGRAALPELLMTSVPMTGSVQFRDSSFEMVLLTTPTAPLQFVLSGVGDLEPARLSTGFLQFLGPTPLPFTHGLVDIERQTPP